MYMFRVMSYQSYRKFACGHVRLLSCNNHNHRQSPYFPPCAHARMISRWGEGSVCRRDFVSLCADESACSSHVTMPNVA